MFLRKPSPVEPEPRRTRAAELPGALQAVCLALLLVGSAVLLGGGCAAFNNETSGQQTRQRRAAAQPAQADAGQPGRPGMTNSTTQTEMTDRNVAKKDKPAKDKAAPAPFYPELEQALKRRKMSLKLVCDENDPVSRRVLEDYGAMFLAASGVRPPPVCMFTSEAAVLDFQNKAKFSVAIVGGARIELQPEAMNALQAAREEARRSGLDITPRGGAEAARRGYEDTLRLWNTRFLPALSHWSGLGRLSKEQVARLRRLALRDQVREVLELEKSGIFFSKDFSKSILYSIAAPGSSQHIAMLALDVSQFADARVRRILAAHGWFQTVKSDLPHFTYLGLDEKDLPARGLRPVKSGEQLFWIPNVTGD